MKRITVPGNKLSPNGSGKQAARGKLADSRAVEGQRRMRAMQSGLRAIVSEMKRVTWPSREEWVAATLVTVGLVVVVALWTSLISWLVSHLLGTAGQ